MKLAYLLIFLILISCASKPVLYPNSKFKKVGKEAAKKDIDQCMQDAETYLESSKGKQVAKSAGAGAVFGAVVGGVSGLITGDVKGGLTQGAAVGAAGGAASGAMSPDQLRQAYTNKCLADKGYKVIGWD